VYVLDSDTISHYFYRKDKHPYLLHKITSTPYKSLWITVISIEEAIGGAYKLIYNRSKVTAGYEILKKMVEYYSKFQILVYNDTAQEFFKAQSKAAKLGVIKSETQA